MRYIISRDEYKHRLINEALSEHVYHYTSISNFEKIIDTDTLKLSTHIGSEADNINPKEYYFLSLTRSKNPKLGYAVNLIGHNGGNFNNIVRIDFNGKTLNQNFKGSSVDYWQRKEPNDTLDNVQPFDQSKSRMMKDFEMEDRLYSNRYEIKPVSKYINSVDILINLEQNITDMVSSLQKRDVPYRIFKTYEDFVSGKNNIDASELNQESDEVVVDEYADLRQKRHNEDIFTKVLAIVCYDSNTHNFDIEKAKDLMGRFGGGLNSDRVIENATEYANKFKYGGQHIADFILEFNGISRDMADKYYLDVLIKEMRKSKTTNIKQFVFLKVYGILPTRLNKNWNEYSIYSWGELSDGKDFHLDKYQIYLPDFKKKELFDNYYAFISNVEPNINGFIDYLLNNFTPSSAAQIVKSRERQDLIKTK